MKYIVLSYDNGNQMVIEAIGPETVLGMVADVLRGNYSAEHEVVRMEIGNMLDNGRQWSVPPTVGQAAAVT